MAMDAGTKLGPYEITSALGAGGMGEVYRATDTRLGRTVAIKVLPSHLSADPQFRQRFDREAKTISQLSHAHICTLHDIGHENGIDFLVMEFLEGETLAQKLSKGPVSSQQALQYGTQIADALDKAHKQNIVHRDLKPGNIMLTKGGAKLLDFGLAKFQASGPQQLMSGVSVLATEAQQNLTAEGNIVGTFQYMAPEQLEGKDADSRTDIFAFGAVLYEMITGKKAFTGKSQASLIAAILEKDPPPMSELQPMTPPALERVVKTCLAKDPDDRWQSAHDLKNELAWIRDGSGSQTQVPVAVGSQRKRLPRWAWGLAGLIVGALVAGIVLLSLPVTKITAKTITRVSIHLPETDHLTFTESSQPIAISPDGQSVVYSAKHDDTTHLFLRKLEDDEAQAIPGTEGGDSPFFSPDGKWIGFVAYGLMKKVMLGGAAPVELTKMSTPLGASWSPNGKIIFGHFQTPLYSIPESGGKQEIVATANPKLGEDAIFSPDVLPGGKGILLQRWSSNPDHHWAVVVHSFSSGERKILVNNAHYGRYVPTGHLVYEHEGSLFAVPFDEKKLELNGNPVRLPEKVGVYEGNALALFTMSANGTLAYVPGGSVIPDRTLVWVDRSGKETPLSDSPRLLGQTTISPEGSRILVQLRPTYDLWEMDLSRDTFSRRTSYGDETNPVWSPDGKRMYYTSTSDGSPNIYSLLVDGSGRSVQLTHDRKIYQRPTSCSPDGKYLAFNRKEDSFSQNSDVWILDLDGEKKSIPFAATAFREYGAVFSPDGKYIAYVSAESGRDQVYIQPFSGEGNKTQVSADGGRNPRWSRDGKEIFYRNGNQMLAVSITTQPSLSISRPVVLFTGDYVSDWNESGLAIDYDVAPDGRFLMAKEVPHESQDRINLVFNWFEELKRSAPAQ